MFSLRNRYTFFDDLIIMLFGVFPLLPNKIKGLPVVLLIISAVVNFLVGKVEWSNKFKRGLLFMVMMSGIYICYLLSGIYSVNIVVFLRKLETGLSLFLIPLSLVFNEKIVTNKNIENFKIVFVFSVFLFTVLFWAYILFDLGSFSLLFEIRTIDLRREIDVMPIISIHPIYASMIYGIGLLLLVSVWRTINKYYFFILFTIFIFNVLVLSSKMVIISLFFIVMFCLIKYTPKFYNKVICFFFILFSLILSVTFIPNVQKRFNEMVLSNTYEKVVIWNSTSIRNGIYNCSLELLEREWLTGYGIGDVQDNLNANYKNKSKVLFANKYNSHNQYLSIWLGTGVVGVVVFTFILGYNFVRAWYFNDLLFLTILVFFALNFLTENLLERQAGVVLFSFLINLFGYNNFNRTKKEVTN